MFSPKGLSLAEVDDRGKGRAVGNGLQFLIYAIAIGVVATGMADLWALFLNRVLGAPVLNFALVGRWIGHFREGRFRHENIARATAVPGEAVIGWATHYVIGVFFAGLLLAIWGLDWARDPSLVPALIVGIVTAAAPFLVMQPGFGFGVFASRTPKPNTARLRTLFNHTSFGICLYLAALSLSYLA